MSRVSPALRQLVIDRAAGCCEYCLLSQADSFIPFEIDHVIAEKHRGETRPENLAFSCPDCNAHKGSDIGSPDPATNILVPLFNPRTQLWGDHFALKGAMIEPLTPEGRVTEFLLKFNITERVAEREGLLELKRYPCLPSDR